MKVYGAGIVRITITITRKTTGNKAIPSLLLQACKRFVATTTCVFILAVFLPQIVFAQTLTTLRNNSPTVTASALSTLGTSANPFTSAIQFRAASRAVQASAAEIAVSASNAYFFNINGQSFSTVTDAAGRMLLISNIAENTSPGVNEQQQYAQTDNLELRTDNLLRSSVFAQLGAAEISTVRITANPVGSGGSFSFVENTTTQVRNQIANFMTLSRAHGNSNENATTNSGSWTAGDATSLARVSGFDCAGLAGTLDLIVFHACGDGGGIHWIQGYLEGNSRLETLGSPNVKDELDVWVLGLADAAASTSNSTATISATTVADGVSPVTLTVTVRNASNVAVANKHVFINHPSSLNFTASQCETDASGQCVIGITSDVVGLFDIEVFIAEGSIGSLNPEFVDVCTYINAEAYIRFEGNVNDSSTNGNNSTSSSGTITYGSTQYVENTTVTPDGANSFYFNGATELGFGTDGAITGFLHRQTSRFSYFIWLKPDDLTGNKIILDEGGSSNGAFLVLEGSTIRAGIFNDSNSPSAVSATIANTNWVHVGVIYNMGTLTLYINGAQQSQITSAPATFNVHGDPSGLGGLRNTNNSTISSYNNFEGHIDEWVYFNFDQRVNATTIYNCSSATTYDADYAFTVTDSSFSESAGTVTVAVQLSSALSNNTSVTYTVDFGSTTQNVDANVPASGSVTINSGSTSGAISIGIVDDALLESSETLQLTLGSRSGVVSLGVPATHLFTIIDNAAIIVTPTTLSVSEAGTTAQFDVVLSSAPTNDVSVNLINNDTSEVSLSTTSLTFNSGNFATTQTVTVSGIEDTIEDGRQVATVSVATTSSDSNYNALARTVSVTVSDNDAPESLTFNVQPANTTAGIDFNVEVSIVNADGTVITDATHTVTLSLSTNPASGVLNGTTTITASNGVARFTGLDIRQSGVGYVLQAATAQTITNSSINSDSFDIAPQNNTPSFSLSTLDASPTTLLANGSNTSTITLTLFDQFGNRLTMGVGSTITFGGTGSADLGTISNNGDGSYSATMTSTVAQSLTLTASLDDGTTTIAFADTASLVFTANEVSISADATTIAEAGGTTTIRLRLANPSSRDVVITISTSSTLLSGSDFTLSSNMATISAGNTETSITLSGVNNNTVAADRILTLAIDTLTNANRSGSSGSVVVSIVNEDVPSISIDSEASANEGDALRFVVRADQAPLTDVSITVSSDLGSAEADDFGTVPATITLLANSTTIGFTVDTTNDAVDEGNESFSVTISADAGATINGASNTAVATIIDNDDADIRVSPARLSVSEDGATAQFDVVLSSAPTNDVTINLINNDTSEVSLSTTSLTFNSGNFATTQTVTVSGIEDTIEDGSQVATVSVATTSSDSNYNGLARTVSVTVSDNDAPESLTFNVQPVNTTAGIDFNVEVSIVNADGTVITDATHTVTLSLSTNPASGVLNGTTTITASNGVARFTGLDIRQSGVGYVLQAATAQTITNSSINSDSFDISAQNNTPSFSLSTLEASPTTLLANGSNTSTITLTLFDQFGNTLTTGVGSTITFGGTGSADLGAISNNGDGSYSATMTSTVAQSLTLTASLDDGTTTIAFADTASLVFTANEVSISADAATIAEAGGTTTIRLRLANPSSRDVVITISTSSTSLSGSDFTLSSNMATIPAGSIDTSITLSGVNNNTVAADRILTLAIDTLTNANRSASSGSVVVTIVNDDVSSISIDSPVMANEGDALSFVVRADQAPLTNVSINVNSDLGSAEADDFDAVPATITLLANSTTIGFTVDTTNDAVDEGDESFSVTISADAGATINGASNTAVATIIDNDNADIRVSPASLSVSEAGTTAQFDVVLSSAPTNDVTINLINNDTSEVSLSTTSLTFNSTNFATTQTVTVSGIEDTIEDGSQVATVSVATTSSDSNYNGLARTVSVTVSDNDAPESLTFNVQPVNTTAGIDFNVEVSIVNADGTVITDATHTVTLSLSTNPASGVLNGTTTITASNGVARFTGLDIRQSGVGYVLQAATAQTITNSSINSDSFDIAPQNNTPSFSLSTLDASPTTLLANGSNTSTITLTLFDQFGNRLTMGVGSTITFGGTGSADLGTISNNGDGSYSATMTSTVAQSLTLTASLDDGTTTIAFADTASLVFTANEVSISADAATIAEAGGTTTIRLRLANPSSRDVVITISTTSTLLSGSDFTLSSNMATISAGNTETSITLSTVNNNTVAADRMLTLAIDTLTNANRSASSGSVVVTIVNDDVSSISIDSPVMANEGDALRFVVRADQAPLTDVSITVSSSLGSAEADDFGAVPATITLLANSTTIGFTVDTTNDAVDEGNESFSVTISADAGATINGASNTAVATIIDNDDADIRVSPASLSVSEAGTTAQFDVVLSSAPTNDVTVNLINNDTSEISLSTTSLTFNSGNFATTQTVTVSGIEDTIEDGSQVATVSVATTSSDSNYTALARTVSVTVSDNDASESLTFNVQPANTTAGIDFNVGVSIVNADGTVITDATHTVTLSLSTNPASGVLNGTTSITASNGVARFTGLDIEQAGAGYVLQAATAQTITNSRINSDSFDISAQNNTPSFSLSTLEANPTTLLANGSNTSTITLTLFDQFGNTLTTGVGSTITFGGTGFADLGAISNNGDGSYSATMTSTVAQNLTLTASLDDGTTTTVLADTASLVFTANEVSISADATTIAEAGGTTTIRLRLANPSSRDVVITISTSSTLLSGSDFTLSSNMATISAGNTETSITLSAVNNNTVAADRILTLAIDTLTNANRSASSGSVVVTIVNDDVSSISIDSPVMANEGDALSFVVRADQAPLTNVSINVNSDLGSAEADDFDAVPATITLLANSTTIGFTVDTTNDAVDEGDESFSVTISADAGATINSASNTAVATIIDNDNADIRVSPVSLSASEAGTTAQFAVVLSSAPTNDVTVNLINNDTSEVSLSTTSLTFNSGNFATTQTVTVSGIEDTIEDGSQVATVSVATTSSDSNYNGLARTVSVTVSDNDAPESLTFNVQPVNTTAGIDFNVEVSIVNADGTVITDATHTVTLSLSTNPASGVLNGTTTITASNGVARFTGLDIRQSGVGYVLQAATAQTITNSSINSDSFDIAPQNNTPSFSLSTLDASPTTLLANGSNTSTITLTLFDQFGNRLTMGVGSTITFGGTGSADLGTISNNGDGSYSATMTSTVAQSLTLTASLDDGTTTIAFADTASLVFTANEVSISADAATIAEAGGTTTIRLRLANPSSRDVVITISTTSTLLSGSDFTLSSNMATISAGNTETSITLSTVNNNTVAADRMLTLAIDTLTNANRSASSGSVVVTIVNDDVSSISIDSPVMANEGDALRFVVRADQAPLTDVSITVSSSLGSAEADDFGAVPATITLLANSTTIGFTVDTTNDAVDEGNESFSVTISADAGATINGASNTAVATIIDNDDADIRVSPASLSVSEAGTTAQFDVVLSSAPTNDVTVNLINNDTSEISLSTTSLTFNSGNFATTQTVTVSGIEDTIEDGSQVATVSVATTSSDSNYNALARTVSVTVSDNDAPESLTFNVQPANTTAGIDFNVEVSIVNADGTVITDATHTVTLSLSTNPASGVLNGTTTITASNGVARFTGLDIEQSGVGYVLQAATAQTITNSRINSDSFDISAQNNTPSFSLSTLEASPTTLLANGSNTSTITLTLLDQFGNTLTTGVGSTITFGGTGFADLGAISNNGDGSYSATMTSTVAQNLTLTASLDDGTTTTVLADTASLVFTANEVSISADATTIAEAGGTTTIRLRLANPSSRDVVITISTSSTLLSGSDFTLSSNMATISAGNTETSITLSAVNNNTVAADRILTLAIDTLTNANRSASSGSVVVTIVNDDVSSISIDSPVMANEGDALSFVVRADQAPLTNVSINVNSDLGSAEADDFDAVPATITLLANSTTIGFTVDTTNDAVDEGDESFSVTISADAGATINGASNTAVATIIDNDNADIRVSPVSLSVSEAGTTAQFDVVLSSAPTNDVSVNLTNNDTSEVSLSTTSLTFNSGNFATTQTVTVSGIEDTIEDGSQVATVSVATTSSDSNYTALARTVSVTVSDNDAPESLTFSVQPANTTAGIDFNVEVSIVNADGAVITDATHTVTLSLSTNPASGVLNGTTSITASNGVARFTGLDIEQAGAGYVLQAATAQTITNSRINSDSFDISAQNNTPSFSLSTLEANPTTLLANGSNTSTITLTLFDQFGNTLTTGVGSTITFGGTGFADLGAISNNGDGSYSATMTSTVAQNLTLTASLDDGTTTTVLADTASLVFTANEVSISADATTIAEAGGTTTIRLRLANPSSRDVVITISTSSTLLSGSDFTLSSNMATISAGNTETSITLSAVNNNTVAADRILTLAIDTLTNANRSASSGSVVVTIVNDDVSSISIDSPVMANEGDALSFVVRADQAPLTNVSINVNSDLGSAEADDFDAVPATITLLANSTTIGFTVDTTNDAVDEGDESFSVTISADAGATINSASNTAVATIIDNDNADIRVSPVSLSASEAGTTAQFAVVLSSAPTNDVTVNLINNDTSEVSLSTTSLTFNSGNFATTQTVTVSGIEDTIEDGSQVATVSVATTSSDSNYNGLARTVSVTVSDNDAPESLTFNVQPVNTTAGIDFNVEVSIVNADGTVITDATHTVTLSLSTNPASGVLNGTTTITASNGVARFTGLDIRQSGVGYVLQAATAQTITNSSINSDSFDIAPQNNTPSFSLSTLDASPTTLLANGSNTSTITLTLFDQFGNRLTMGVGSTITFGGTGSADLGTISNNGDGSYSATMTSTVAQSLTLTASLDDGTTTIAFADTASLVFTANEVSISADAATIAEAGGTTTIRLRLANPSSRDVVITISTTSTLLSGSDFTLSSNMATISAGNTETSITLSTVNNNTVAADRMLTLAIDTLTNANRSASSGSVVVTIVNDDVSSISIDSPVMANEGDALRFVVRADQAPLTDVSITVSSSLGSAEADDFGAVPATITLLANSTTIGFTVDTTNDAVDEGNESFSVTISADAGATINGASNTAVATIIDNDDADIRVSPASLSVSEAGTTAQFDVVLSSAPTNDVTVNLINNDTSEISLSTTSLTFNSGNFATTQTVTVSGIEDTIEDGSQVATVSVATTSSDSNYNALARTVSVTVSDNDAPESLTFNVQPANTTAGIDFNVEVSIVNADGTVITDATHTVTLSLSTNPASGVLNGTTTITASNGVARFTGLDIEQSGVGYVLQAATAQTITNSRINSDSFDISAQNNTPSFSLSTLEASPTTLLANGSNTSTITLTLLDQFGNTLTTGVGSTITFGGTGAADLGTISNNGDGSYSATMTSTVAQNLTLTASLNDGTTTIAFADTASLVFTADNVAGNAGNGANATNTIVTVSPNSVTMNTTATITVQLADANDNLLTVGGATVTLTASGSAVIGAVTDNGDGSYSAEINNAIAETVTIMATVAGININDTALLVVTDVTAPGVPTFSTTDGITLSGTAEANASIVVMTADGRTLTTTVDSIGNWTVTANPALTEGEVVTVIAIDAQGNMSNTNSLIVSIIDTDSDGLADSVDPNDNNIDTDGDGIADGADVDVDGDGTPDNGVDSDGDGINDAADVDANPGAIDTDGDGIIDALDVIDNSNTGLVDADSDGLDDSLEAADGDNTDSDSDGISDDVERFISVDTTSVNNLTDTNNNGIPDVVEVSLGLNPVSQTDAFFGETRPVVTLNATNTSVVSTAIFTLVDTDHSVTSNEGGTIDLSVELSAYRREGSLCGGAILPANFMQVCQPLSINADGGVSLLTGQNNIWWIAVDAAGNWPTGGAVAQTINVVPQIFFSNDFTSVTNATIAVTVSLSGNTITDNTADSPLTVPFTVVDNTTGTALSSGEFSFSNNSETSEPFIFTAGPNAGSITLVFDSNAAVFVDDVNNIDIASEFVVTGENESLTITIISDNVNPQVNPIVVNADGENVSVIIVGETLFINANAFDANADELTFEWSDNVPAGTTESFTITSTAVDIGVRTYSVTVSDGEFSASGDVFLVIIDADHNPINVTELEQVSQATGVDLSAINLSDSTDSDNDGNPDVLTRLIAEQGLADANADGMPDVLENLTDTDNDGVVDLIEGLAVDTDGDRIPDFIEPMVIESNNRVLQLESNGTRFVTTEPNLELRLGETAFEALINSTDFNLSIEVTETFTNELGEQQRLFPEDESALEVLNDIADFEVTNLAEFGQQVRIVIPLRERIPVTSNGLRYRKYFETALSSENNNVADDSVRVGWQDFDVDSRPNPAGGDFLADQLHSAEQISNGVCPNYNASEGATVGSAVWVEGLVGGYQCLRLTIRDGGPNDADNTANGVITDPGTLVVVQRFIDENNSSITLGHSTLVADGAEQTQVTISMRDSANEVVVGAAIQLSASEPSVSFSTLTDNGDGSYVATLTSGTVVGDVTITASISADNRVITETVVLTLISTNLTPIKVVSGGGGSLTMSFILMLLIISVLTRQWLSIRQLLTALLSMLLSMMAIANDDKGFYVGFGINQSSFDAITDNTNLVIDQDSDTGLHSTVGYRFNDNWRSEFNFVSLGESTINILAGDNAGDFVTAVNYRSASLGINWLPFNQNDWYLQPYLGLGGRYFFISSSSSQIEVEAVDEFQYYYSAGIEGQLTHNWKLRVGFNGYAEDTSAVLLSVLYNYGEKQPKYSRIKQPSTVSSPDIASNQPIVTKSEDEPGFIPVNQPADTDQDGINDDQDHCPNTPVTDSIDRHGCSIVTDSLNMNNDDSDNDAVASNSNIDVCPNSKTTNIDAKGGLQLPIIYFAQNVISQSNDLESIMQIVNFMLNNPAAHLTINGHSSRVSEEDNYNYNMSLSQQRAKTVYNRLIKKGISVSRLSVKAHGWDKPVCSNETAEGRQYNQRVDFDVTVNANQNFNHWEAVE